MQRYMNTSNVPLALAVFLATDHYDHNSDPYTISATTLLKPLRQIILPTRVPPQDGLVNLADQMSNRLGSAIHDGIERAWRTNYKQAMLDLGHPQGLINRVRIDPTDEELAANPGIIPFYMEQRASRKLGKWTVTGKWDFVGNGRVEDYKTASTWSYKNQVNADKQQKQGSIYRWLDPKKITADEMAIHHIFMDWKQGMVKTDPAYPPERFHTQLFLLLSMNETEAFIRRKIALIEQYWDADEDKIPLCDEEDLWRSAPQFKYYKSGTVTARSTKNFDDKTTAMNYMANEGGGKGIILDKLGEVKACKYCAAFPVCTQKDALIACGDLVL
jgi:hypothetical protein